MRRQSLRFRVVHVLYLMAIAAMLFGYAQWRRQSLRRECELLSAQGIEIRWPEGAASAVWPVMPKEATMAFLELPDGSIKIGEKGYTPQEADVLTDGLLARCRRLGIEAVTTIRNGKTEYWVEIDNYLARP